jgi:outer membrane protein OmpA-like peptidoglycan-associated protein
MLPNKSLAFALCLAVTGCAQTPSQSGDTGPHWWQFGFQQPADKGVEQAVNDRVVKADAASNAKAQSEQHWWWPFASSDKAADVPAVAAVPKIDAKATKAWLDNYEPKVREALKDSNFQVERREDLLVITVPADSNFNPKRPEMLLPVTLGPITRVAKVIETDPKTAALVLGHADTSGASSVNQALSLQRAQSVASIFRLSGLQRDRLNLRGMGSVMPRAANDSVEGRALNRRVEIMLTPQDTMLALVARYNQPTPPVAEMVAVQDVKPLPATTAKPAAAAAKKTTGKKTAAAKPAATKKKAAPAKAAAPAKKTVAKKATTVTTSNN